jgi:hypothetical protein
MIDISLAIGHSRDRNFDRLDLEISIDNPWACKQVLLVVALFS